MQFLLERAGFNRWSPAMEGKRSQAVFRKHLLAAAHEVDVNGVPLSERLYVPEQFNEVCMAEAARRRFLWLSMLPCSHQATPLAIVIGEFKGHETGAAGQRVWIRHMPDLPLLASNRSWQQLMQRYEPLLQMRDALSGQRARVLMAALVRIHGELIYEIDTTAMLLAHSQWLPVTGAHELPLLNALIAAGRRFIKPLRYRAAADSVFPNVLLLDADRLPVPLYIASPFLPAPEKGALEAFLGVAPRATWVWQTNRPMPPLPPPAIQRGDRLALLRHSSR
jgi:hypothetical protein